MFGQTFASREKMTPNKAVEFIYKNSELIAKAKAKRVYLEEFRKVKKALLMQDMEGSVAAQERDAYAHQDYKELLEELKKAVEQEEALRWKMISAQAHIEVWRSQEASNRAEMKLV